MDRSHSVTNHYSAEDSPSHPQRQVTPVGTVSGPRHSVQEADELTLMLGLKASWDTAEQQGLRGSLLVVIAGKEKETARLE